ncbi:MAG TPA: thiamine phosphate synthase [Chloroflexota bacterium]|nr:thiamine phosphate synthase [Chloroflexota bacterium]
MGKFQLHVITEPKRDFDELRRSVDAAMRAGADWVQLRDKGASAQAMYRQALELRHPHGRLSINDRVDVALACGAAGAHLAAQSLPVAEAKRIAAGRLLVGRSVHALDEAIQAARDGADYLTFGHVFPSSSKPGQEPRGVAQLAEIVEAVGVPVVAIGGINAANLDQVLATGCAGIAVISAVLSAPDPGLATAELRRALDASPHQPRRSFESLEGTHAPDAQPTAV